jgi:hypothetical protein
MHGFFQFGPVEAIHKRPSDTFPVVAGPSFLPWHPPCTMAEDRRQPVFPVSNSSMMMFYYPNQGRVEDRKPLQLSLWLFWFGS